jgi:hypothetical protein
MFDSDGFLNLSDETMGDELPKIGAAISRMGSSAQWAAGDLWLWMQDEKRAGRLENAVRSYVVDAHGNQLDTWDGPSIATMKGNATVCERFEKWVRTHFSRLTFKHFELVSKCGAEFCRDYGESVLQEAQAKGWSSKKTQEYALKLKARADAGWTPEQETMLASIKTGEWLTLSGEETTTTHKAVYNEAAASFDVITVGSSSWAPRLFVEKDGVSDERRAELYTLLFSARATLVEEVRSMSGGVIVFDTEFDEPEAEALQSVIASIRDRNKGPNHE